MTLSAEHGRFLLHGLPSFLRFGEMHYFRIRPELWRGSLERLKQAGLNGISTYVPWVWHEPEEGLIDFDGHTHPGRNLHRFLNDCREADMSVLVRPGPFIYAEYDGLGHPLWLGRRYPETVVQRPDGRADAGEFWFNHALGHPIYRAHVAGWFEKVLGALNPHCGDPVAALQLDNETGLMYGRSVGKIDWNPDTVKRYRHFLSQRYEDIACLNRAWGTDLSGWESVFPPQAPFGHAPLHDWQDFLEDWVCDYLSWLAGLVRRQTALPLFLNEQATFFNPANPRRKSVLTDFYGYDCYAKMSGTRHASDYPFLAAVSADLFGAYARPASPLFSAEMGVGWFDPRSRVPERAVAQNIMAGLAHGLNGMCLYTVHDCREENGQEYCYHSLLDSSGRPDSKFAITKSIHEFIQAHEEVLTRSVPVRDAVATLTYSPVARTVPEDFLPGHRLPDPARYVASQGLHGVHALLLLSGYNPGMLDLEKASLEDLARFRVLFFPNNGYVDRLSYGKLLTYVQNGGILVTLPVHPTHDLDGRPLDTATLYPDTGTGERLNRRIRLLARALLRWGGWYPLVARRRLARNHLFSMHLIDLFEPARALLTAPLGGIRLKRPDGRNVRGDLVSAGFAPRGDSQILAYGRAGETVAYAASVGKGTSVVLGTLLGGALMLPEFYRLPGRQIDCLRDLLRDWMSQFGPTPRTTVDRPLEVSYRAAEDYTFVFMINRGARKKGHAVLSRELCHGSPEVLWKYGSSSAVESGPGEVDYDLCADGVVVLGFSGAAEPAARA